MTATDELRVVGTRNLVEAAEQVGATRFVTQSMVFGYGYDDPTQEVRTEEDRFAPFGRGRFEDHLAAMRSNEAQVLGSAGLEGVALRYGLFYGVGAGDEFLVPQLHRRVVPVLRQAAPHSFVYLDDAVSATVAALERGRGGEAYNVVDDEPVSWTDFVAELARAVGAPPPRVVPDRLLAALPYLRAVLRGGTAASNAKARRELGWRPAVPTYRDGARLLAGSHRGGSDRAPAS